MKIRIARKVLKRAFQNGGFNIDGRFFVAALRYRRWMRLIQRRSDHAHWRFVHSGGRRCSCGILMFDPDD